MSGRSREPASLACGSLTLGFGSASAIRDVYEASWVHLVDLGAMWCARGEAIVAAAVVVVEGLHFLRIAGAVPLRCARARPRRSCSESMGGQSDRSRDAAEVMQATTRSRL